MNKTALQPRHLALGAKMTEFHGWDMPLYYTSIIEEHMAVRQAAGLFDVSHMGQVVVKGPDAVRTLNRLLVSDIVQVGIGRACYTLMLNDAGGILDDLIVFRLGAEDYLVIVNCSTRESDVAWMNEHLVGSTTITDISEGRGILAVQGPLACRLLEQILDARVTSLGRFDIAPIRTMSPEACIARTGYTGGDGFELFLPNTHLLRVWDAILTAAGSRGVKPVGLGARDTLRVEAGLRLNGTDMDAATSPIEVGLEWTVAWNKPDFIGRQPLLKQKQQGVGRKFVGFELAQGPVPRQGYELTVDPAAGGAGGRRVGTVTSGTFSQMLNRPIGMGYVEPACAKPGTELTMTVRSQRHTAKVVKLPFWKAEAPAPVLSKSTAATLEKLS
ncbi:MAG: glycine cleavage system aminomethyltransferase GcvT [Candidatus Omnitrophica bacterium]|nr:glycine cleavage system aminomethyltransferase GcvT [Candidatus Omnitrophota bacterium]